MKTNLLFTLLFSFTTVLFAQRPGDLDATFNGGKVIVDKAPQEAIRLLHLQPDGKIVAGGISGTDDDHTTFVLTRFNTNGGMDASFGNGGIVNTGFFYSGFYNFSFAVQPDGKTVAATVHDDTLFAVRYNLNGTPDQTFKHVEVTDSGRFSSIFVQMLSNGEIALTAGFSLEHSGSTIYTLFCGTDGKIERRSTIPLPGYSDLKAAALQPDNKLVVLSSRYGIGAFALTRINTDGMADETFGSGGTTLNVQQQDPIDGDALALQSDGKIVVTGTTNYRDSDGAAERFALMRFNSDGSPDARFGDNGKMVTPGDVNAIACGMFIQKDDKILVAGFLRYEPGNSDFILVRYNDDGSIDHHFGTDGSVTTHMNKIDAATALVQQPDGKIVVGGNSGTSWGAGEEDMNFGLVRYHCDGGTKFPEATIPNATANISITGSLQGEQLLQYTLDQDGNITIELYDVSGRLLMILASNEPRSAGTYNETLRLDDSLPSGRYLLALSTAQGRTSQWVVKQ